MVEVQHTWVAPSESEFIRGFCYLPESQVLEVRIKHDDNGQTAYYYMDIPQYVYDGFKNADSYGSYYHSRIKAGNYGFRDHNSDTELRELEKDMKDLLLSEPFTITSTVRRHDPELYNQNRELFEMLADRQYDRHLINVEGHENFIQFTIRIIHGLIAEALDILTEEYGEDEPFVAECIEIAEESLEESRNYTILQTI